MCNVMRYVIYYVMYYVKYYAMFLSLDKLPEKYLPSMKEYWIQKDHNYLAKVAVVVAMGFCDLEDIQWKRAKHKDWELFENFDLTSAP